jgi:hypothetical protein
VIGCGCMNLLIKVGCPAYLIGSVLGKMPPLVPDRTSMYDRSAGTSKFQVRTCLHKLIMREFSYRLVGGEWVVLN